MLFSLTSKAPTRALRHAPVSFFQWNVKASLKRCRFARRENRRDRWDLSTLGNCTMPPLLERSPHRRIRLLNRAQPLDFAAFVPAGELMSSRLALKHASNGNKYP